MSGLQRLVSQGVCAHWDPTPKTYACIHEVPLGSTAVGFELINCSATEAVTYNAAFSLSAGINDWFTPLDAAGHPNNAMWQRASLKGDYSIRLPPATRAGLPTRVLTDIIPFDQRPPKRIGSGSGILIFFRLYPVSGPISFGFMDGTVGNWRDFPNGRNPLQFSRNLGGSWSNQGNWAAGEFAQSYYAPNISSVILPAGIIAAGARPMITIMSSGDSMLSGVASRPLELDQGANGVGLHLAKILDRPERPALHRNEALSGLNSDCFLSNCVDAMAIYAPDVLLLQTYTANDPDRETREGVWKSFAAAIEVARKARESGVAVILLTSPPFAGVGGYRYSEEWEEIRLFANELVLSSGIPHVDCDAVVGAGARPEVYRPGRSQDQVHPNDVASAELAAAAAAALAEEYGVI
nr:hypothetical protein [uncultured Rhodopila sp.]